MKNKACILMVLALAFPVVKVRAESAQTAEYKVKTAFLYNFIKFVEWPAEKDKNNKDVLSIGIIGSDETAEAFESLKGKKAKDKEITIKKFGKLKDLTSAEKKDSDELKAKINELRKCHVVFIAHSEKGSTAQILEELRAASVLTVGEKADFLKLGGVINFVIDEKKVRFEVNMIAAKRAELQIRSKLLKLAKNVIE